MKANFNFINKNTILCKGVKKMYGKFNIKTKDLRSSATLIIAACVAEGTSIIKNVNHIYRGYENFKYKLKKLGADIKLIKN